jgi:hypothetical protein
MILGITGGTGFIGYAVQKAAVAQDDRVILFSRKAGMGRRLLSFTEPLDVSGCEGLVHLAGESIMGLWTRAKRRRILESRVEGTRRLVEGIAAATIKPRVLVSASAIGYYGDTGDRLMDEDSAVGRGFLAEVTQAWEEEAQQAESLGVRVVRLRIGLVLGAGGGAMKLLAPLFRAGLGGRLGSGQQWVSCIGIQDLAAMVLTCLHDETLRGAVNAVMPEPVTNREFTKLTARAAHRPAIFPVPAWVLRLLLGDLSSLMLSNQRVLPSRLTKWKFHYRETTVEAALQQVF